MTPTRFRHTAMALTVLGGVVLTFPGIAAAQGAKTKGAGAADKQLDGPQNVRLNTRDQFPLHATYYKSLRGKEAPVAVLVHEENGNRFVWQGKDGLAERLQKEGYAVLTIDLRQHGESRTGPGGNANQGGAKGGKKGASELKPGDYAAMVEYDMETVKAFLYDEHQAGNLNMNKLGIVAAEMGANVATAFAANDWLKEPHADAPAGSGAETPRGQDVRALILISPKASLPGNLVMSQALQALRPFPVAMLFAVSKQDTKNGGQTKKLFDQASAFDRKNERVFFQDYPGKLNGTDMLNHGLGLEAHVVHFLNEHVMKIDSQWRDRQSRLDKRGK